MLLMALSWLALTWLPGPCAPGPVVGGPAVGTFNIRDFPKNERQVALAFAEVRALGVPVVALQEITDADALKLAVARELGPRWTAVVVDAPGSVHNVAVLVDGARATLESSQVHDATRIDGRGRDTLEARVRLNSGQRLRLYIVHLKAGGAEHADTRQRQLQRLQPIVAAGVATDDRVIVLGDFNTTTVPDRVNLAAFAAQTGLVWTTEGLACTAYWDRTDRCEGSALDHALVEGGGSAEALGPCRAVGCDTTDRCPVFHGQVSDHCPLRVGLQR